MSSLKCLFFIVVITASGLVLPKAARAESGKLHDALAIEFKATGDAEMQATHYEKALTAYERASEIEGSPILLFNRGRALQALKRYPEALDLITRFSDQASPELKAKAGDLGDLMANLRQHISSLEVVCSVPGAQAVLAGKTLGSTPFPAPIRVNAGSSHLTISADGYVPFEADLELPAGGEKRVAVDLVRRKSEGHLTVNSTVGAVAFADGVRLGSVPAEVTLASGRHQIRVEHPDFLASETGVEILADQNRSLDFPLERKASVLGRWWFWTGAAVVVAAGATAVIFAVTERAPTNGDIPPGKVAAPLLTF